jgi:hypothetical protein
MATYFLEFSDQNYSETGYSIRKVPMGQSKFTAQSFKKKQQLVAKIAPSTKWIGLSTAFSAKLS